MKIIQCTSKSWLQFYLLFRIVYHFSMEKECKCSLIKEYPLRRGKVGVNIEKEFKNHEAESK